MTLNRTFKIDLGIGTKKVATARCKLNRCYKNRFQNKTHIFFFCNYFKPKNESNNKAEN
jgi:hypothetical protein